MDVKSALFHSIQAAEMDLMINGAECSLVCSTLSIDKPLIISKSFSRRKAAFSLPMARRLHVGAQVPSLKGPLSDEFFYGSSTSRMNSLLIFYVSQQAMLIPCSTASEGMSTLHPQKAKSINPESSQSRHISFHISTLKGRFSKNKAQEQLWAQRAACTNAMELTAQNSSKFCQAKTSS